MIKALNKSSWIKIKRRVKVFAGHAAWQAFGPISHLLVSIIIVRLSALEMWGEIVSQMIALNLIMVFARWGSRDYLLRRFAKYPALITGDLYRMFVLRLPFLILFIPVVLIQNLAAENAAAFVLWGIAQYVFQSLEPLILFRKNYKQILWSELTGIAVLILLIMNPFIAAGLTYYIFAFAFSALSKTITAIILMRRFLFPVQFSRQRVNHLKSAANFFLVDISGMLSTRIDIYIVAFLLSASELGIYQILMSILISVQTIANFIVAPFVKEFYRLPVQTISRLPMRLFKAGIVILVLALPGIYVLMNLIYRIELGPEYYLCAAFFIMPLYYILPVVYRLFRQKQQQTVVIISFGSAIGNAILTIILADQFGLIGALIAGTSLQLIIWAIYACINKNFASKQESAVTRQIETVTI